MCYNSSLIYTFRECSSPHEVHLSSHARVHLASDGVGADLSGEVDLEARVDGSHFGVLFDHHRIVDPLRRTELDHRVVVHKVVQTARAQDEPHRDDIGRHPLVLSGYHLI